MTEREISTDTSDAPPSDPRALAEKIRTGEYFREMKRIYASQYLDPMSDRYFFAGYTALALLIFVFIAGATLTLFPLSNPIPYFHYSADVFEEKPVIKPLKTSKDEDANIAIQRFFVSEYVARREEYDIRTLESNVRFIRAQSTEDAYNRWQAAMDPGNPESPISQFQRNATRKINVLGARANQDGTMDVIYDAIVRNTETQEEKPTRMIATLAFQYSGVTINQETAETTPVQFIVTDFRSRRLQE